MKRAASNNRGKYFKALSMIYEQERILQNTAAFGITFGIEAGNRLNEQDSYALIASSFSWSDRVLQTEPLHESNHYCFEPFVKDLHDAMYYFGRDGLVESVSYAACDAGDGIGVPT